MRSLPQPVYQAPPGKHPAHDPHNPRRLIRCYGCCRCQREHREGLDAEYADHLLWQSKHGPYTRLPTTGEAAERLMAEDTPDAD